MIPIISGMTTNRFFPDLVKMILPFCPVVAMVITCLLVGSSVGQASKAIILAGSLLQVPVMLMHLLGGMTGYALPRLLGFKEVTCRTLGISTAMKSSAFGFFLAKQHFQDDAVPIPSAVSVVWIVLIGSIMGVVWRQFPIVEDKATETAS